ncbi:eukaryotic translation initiation factor 4E type 2-like [Dysidea avara]|uniref:eukaryotic translation initiation factor 4E type 2-like n=1 Tax=Dysidea avara TaxID=196820 RepID=UPI00331755D2
MASSPENDDAFQDDDQNDVDKQVSIDPIKKMNIMAPQIGDTEHQLQYAYSLWFMERDTLPSQRLSSSSSVYEDNIKLIATFSSVEQFWALYTRCARPGDLAGFSDIHLFKLGIKPMWEDEANQHGGKWMIRLKKGIASRCWENLILAMLGEQFMVGDEICGAVVSVRPNEDIVSLWNRTASDHVVTSRIRDTLTRVLSLPPNTIMEYKMHMNSIRDKTSYRNTDVFVR